MAQKVHAPKATLWDRTRQFMTAPVGGPPSHGCHTRLMLAAIYDRFGGPVTVREVSEPEPGPDDALIAVRATGVCRSDWHGWQGHDPDIKTLPHVPGHEFSGTIVALGSDVQHWKVGDRIVVPFITACGRCEQCLDGNAQVCSNQTQAGFTHWGSFAERVVVHNADFNLVALPEPVDFSTGAALGCRFTTAFRAVEHQGRAREGTTVAVFGCGGVGLSAVMIAKALGADVIAVDPNPGARDKALELGASRAIDSADVLGELSPTASDRPHVTIDALGDPEVAGIAMAALRPQGRHVQVGLLPNNGFASVPAKTVIAKELEIVGSHGMAATDFPKLIDLVVEGRLMPQRLIGDEVDLQDGINAMVEMSEKSPVGMTVITSI
jgi:D-arabinose 1-dehydrogenase-like Zn-dependent alcohol dehydrogenase